MFFLSRKIEVILFSIILAAGLGIFGVVSSSASEPRPMVALSGISPALDQPVMAPPPPKKFALIIGIVYDNNQLGNVKYADADATSVYNLLNQRMGFPAENIILLRNGEATRENINKALKWLTENPQIDGDSDVVLYYSGHGLKGGPDTGINFPGLSRGYALVPFDVMNFDYKHGDGLIWDWQLADQLGRISPGRMWINIDSCFSGGFTRPGIAGPNRVLTLSSQEDELSSEIDETNRGVFMQYLIEEGVARGLPIEQAFWASIPKTAEGGYSQNPQIADNYPGNLDFSAPRN